MYRTLLVVALSSIFGLSYAADNTADSYDSGASQPYSAPATKKSKRNKVKQPTRSNKVKVAPPKVVDAPDTTDAADSTDGADVADSPEFAAPKSSKFTLASEDIAPNSTIPQIFESDSFGCTGDNSSPELHWSGAPADTKSFAVTVYDPDAPSGSGWWHWVVYDLPADTDRLDPGVGTLNSSSLPGNAMQALSDFGVQAWGGTCPPQGDKPHRYIFTVHALNIEQLDVPNNATPAMVGYMIHANTLATASFTARYGRRK
ncbi:MAG: YbhB/YbcL family Raf kinase inhibitor-like protein [Gallionella sp.]|nr:YbhB/YbcL family Raf kinase inhibitor-like protein [Gallionella sp.]